MSESETQNTENDEPAETTEPTETVETDVELAEQPPGSQPTEIPAAEPEDAAPVEETSPEAPAAEAAPAETAPAAEEGPAAEAAPAAKAAPAAPPGEPRKKRLKHIPRSERRNRTKRKREQPTTRKPIVRLEKPVHEKGRRQERRGVVVSDTMDKTIVVKVESVRAHQMYKKVIRRSVKFHAHDEQNEAHVGDRVRIVETRPLSKTKRWRLAEVIEVAK
jgi:small subunit ribosomal protein S17